MAGPEQLYTIGFDTSGAPVQSRGAIFDAPAKDEAPPADDPLALLLAGGGGGAGYSPADMHRIDQFYQQKEQAVAPFREQVLKDLAAGSQVQPPQMQQIPSYRPPPPDPQAFKGFFGMAMAFAAIAGLATRAPLTAALNMMSGAMTGYAKGEKDKADASFAQFQEQFKEAMARNQQMLQEYQLALEKNRGDTQRTLAAMNIVAQQYDDKIGQYMARQQNMAGFEKHLLTMLVASSKLKEEGLNIEKQQILLQMMRSGEYKTTAQMQNYQYYVRDQQERSLPIKSFDDWLASHAQGSLLTIGTGGQAKAPGEPAAQPEVYAPTGYDAGGIPLFDDQSLGLTGNPLIDLSGD